LTFWKVEELALEGDGLSGKSPAHYFERLVGSRAALFERHTKPFELFPLEADAGAELETAPGDDIDCRDILGKADRIVKRHQEHARCDADPIGAGSDRRGCGQYRGKISVFNEVVLRQPNIIKPVVLAPCDLIEDFAVEPVGRLAPLWWIAEVIPKTKAYFAPVVTHDPPLLIYAPILRSEQRRRPRTARCR
jgi:hypothetical protein